MKQALYPLQANVFFIDADGTDAEHNASAAGARSASDIGYVF